MAAPTCAEEGALFGQWHHFVFQGKFGERNRRLADEGDSCPLPIRQRLVDECFLGALKRRNQGFLAEDENTLRVLLEAGWPLPLGIRVGDTDCPSGLASAVEAGHSSVIGSLLAAGADPNGPSGEPGRSCLMQAAARHPYVVVENVAAFQQAASDWNRRDPSGATLVHLACAAPESTTHPVFVGALIRLVKVLLTTEEVPVPPDLWRVGDRQGVRASDVAWSWLAKIEPEGKSWATAWRALRVLLEHQRLQEQCPATEQIPPRVRM